MHGVNKMLVSAVHQAPSTVTLHNVAVLLSCLACFEKGGNEAKILVHLLKCKSQFLEA